jgi:hypothetical protein
MSYQPAIQLYTILFDLQVAGYIPVLAWAVFILP